MISKLKKIHRTTIKLIIMGLSTCILASNCYAGPTLIAKISLSKREIQNTSQLEKALKEQHISCLTKQSWGQTRVNNKIEVQELWTLKSDTEQSKASFIQALKKFEFIKKIEDVLTVDGQSWQNDPLSDQQHHIQNPNLHQLIAHQAADVLVAILDTGIDRHHNDLQNMIYINEKETINGKDDDNNGYIDDRYGYDFSKASGKKGDPIDDHGHGTHLAGIIAAQSKNQQGIVGVAQNAKLLNIKCLNASSSGTQLNVSAAIKYAADQGAKVINCSWAIKNPSWILKEAVTHALNKGAIIVASAGNNNQPERVYPASYDGVISVSALNKNQELSEVANKKAKFDLAIYGEDVLSTMPNNNYQSKSGTSQSTALLSGILSKVIGINPKLNPENIKKILNEASIIKEEANTSYKILDPQRLLSGLYTYFAPNTVQSQSTPVNLKNTSKFWPNPLKEGKGKFKISSPNTTPGTLLCIEIYNEIGQLKKSIDLNYNPNNIHQWDGKDDHGIPLKNGTYIYLIKNKFNTYITSKGLITILN